MTDSLFWRTMAVIAVGGIFYAGARLGDRHASLSAIESTAHAGSVAFNPAAGSIPYFVTTNEEGSIVNVWRLDRSGSPSFVGSARQENER